MHALVSLGELAIGEDFGSPVATTRLVNFWVLIGGQLESKVMIDSLSIDESGDGITRARCMVETPNTRVIEGKTFEVIFNGAPVFAGIIKTVTVDADQSEASFMYAVEADGWDLLLARHLITASYANKTAGFILRDAITASGINLDGVTAGVINDGVELILVEADHVRVGDFIRDVGAAGGGLAYIDAYKRIQFRPTTLDVSEVAVTNARAEKITHMGDTDNYRNRQIIKVTGLNGTTTVTETRDDLVQQALRISEEGGSGIYEAYESITHPTSSVSGELSILGQTVGFVNLRTYARNARRVTVTMRDPAPRIGQLATLDLPGFTLSGTFVTMRKTWRDVAGEFLFEVEFWESSFQRRALESLLRIVGAAKSSVAISSNVFPNSQLFSTAGADTWTVPAGVTTAQFTSMGGSGAGGSGLCSTGGPFFGGGNGGNSGKAVTILAVTAGQVYDLVVGAKGLIGGVPSDGGAGGFSSVKLSTTTICRGDAGLGGGSASTSPPCVTGATGAHGSGLGDAIVVGGGKIGGAGSYFPSSGDGVTGNGFNGLAGLIEVRW